MAWAPVKAGFFAAMVVGSLVAGSGCGSSPVVASAPPSAASAAAPAAVRPPAPSPSSSAPAVAPSPLDDAAIFSRVKDGLAACYAKGRASVPTMLDGQLTLNASFDAAGTPTCVIVSDDRGLTQEVEDCMAAHLGTQRLEGASGRPISLRIALRGGQLALATAPRETTGIESVETHRMPDAFDALEALTPKLQACMSGVSRGAGARAVLVGARVATSGRTRCALAIGSPDPLPAEAATCAETAFRNATFPAPSGGEGLILVPMTLVRR